MNKKPLKAVGKRAQILERELMRSTIAGQDEIDTGRRKVREKSKWQLNATERNNGFYIRQGVRRRHPEHVLNNFKAIADTTTASESTWEKALTQENERVMIDPDYKPKADADLMATQLGLVTPALSNFANSKYKLEQTMLVGV
jgi:hypothetical protein